MALLLIYPGGGRLLVALPFTVGMVMRERDAQALVAAAAERARIARWRREFSLPRGGGEVLPVA